MAMIDKKKLVNSEERLSLKYGVPGSVERMKFEEQAQAYYYGVILRDRRKELKITQKELAERVGTARSYIARVEKGETDMQLSSLLRIARALGIEFKPTFAPV